MVNMFDGMQRLSDIMIKDKNDKLALRVSVESGGCHGFQYLMSLTDKVEEDDTYVSLSCFQRRF